MQNPKGPKTSFGETGRRANGSESVWGYGKESNGAVPTTPSRSHALILLVRKWCCQKSITLAQFPDDACAYQRSLCLADTSSGARLLVNWMDCQWSQRLEVTMHKTWLEDARAKMGKIWFLEIATDACIPSSGKTVTLGCARKQ